MRETLVSDLCKLRGKIAVLYIVKFTFYYYPPIRTIFGLE
jgi:hypothetical protein